MKTGSRLVSAVSTTEVMVVKGADVVLECGGEPMVDPGAERRLADPTDGDGCQLGKRYSDEVSGLQVLCVKAGPGPLTVEGRPLETMAAKQLPSSD